MVKKRPERSTIRVKGPKPSAEEVPPVIVKGGNSLLVRFPDVDFDSDADAQKKVKKTTHPNAQIKIFKVEIRDNRKGKGDRLLCFFDATDVDGSIDINVFAE